LRCGNAARIANIAILTVVAPLFRLHEGRDISPILLRQIAKDMGLWLRNY